MPSLRDTIRPALFEAIFVVLGVVLALAANEGREAWQHRRQGEVAMRDITSELRANRAAVAASLAYHQQLLDSLRVPRAPANPPTLMSFRRGFVSPAQVSTTAWSVASGTGVVTHIPYSTVLVMSRAYALQARYEDQARSVAEVLYGEMYRGGPSSIAANYRNLSSIIGMFYYKERELIARYDSTLTIIGPAGAPALASAAK